MDRQRRSFLHGRMHNDIKPARPPWSLPEAQFTRRCTRCGDCIQQCANGILQPGEGGFPETDFSRNGCNFCGQCANACKSGALLNTLDSTPWSLNALIKSSCLAQQKIVCRTCGERCEIGALQFRMEAGGVATPQVDAKRCNGCGMCVADCPVHAISLQACAPFEEVAV